MIGSHAITLAPLLPWPLLVTIFGLAALIVIFGLIRRAAGAGWRLAALTVLFAALLNPTWVSELRQPVKDTAVIVLDQSFSQSLGLRASRAENALAALQQKLATFADLELRVVRTEAGRSGETRLFAPLEAAFADVPRRQRAGAILLTDGQVHDVPPSNAASLQAYGPVHTLLTGDHDEADRRLEIVGAPSYGLVGKPTSLTFRVVDLPFAQTTEARVALRIDGGPERMVTVPVGEEVPLRVTPSHGGPTVVELTVEPAPRELSLLNNRAGVAINAVRDRLKVLLISGEPYAGERTWRNVLKSDPAVDLVHFTILRPPDKQDGTPIRELSLIPFPIRELFEVKLREFDLIIFDRYRQRGVLPIYYLESIAEFVRKGGALLAVGGAGLGDPLGMPGSPLGEVLPGLPTGPALEMPFLPNLTELGRRHPVTAGLAAPGASPWGRWLRQADLEVSHGAVVMTGAQGRPLLILDRIGQGRVAQLASDQIWLWSRGFEGGGPQAELLRRLAHWLMKEPELEEDELSGRAEAGHLKIQRRSLRPSNRPVTLTPPSGEAQTLTLREEPDGIARAETVASAPGLYRLTDGERQAVILVEGGNGPEFTDLRTSPERLAPIARATGGGVFWLVDGTGALPELRRPAPGHEFSGPSWLGLTANGATTLSGRHEAPLVPAPLLMLVTLVTLAMAWRREGR